MPLGISSASLLENILARKGVIRSGKGASISGEDFNATSCFD